MRKKFLQISTLGLITGLCLYGGTVQSVRAETTTIHLPDGNIFKGAATVFTGGVQKVKSSDGKEETFASLLRTSAKDKNNREWNVAMQLKTRPRPYVKGSKRPALSKDAITIGSVYTKLTVSNDLSEKASSYGLGADAEVKVNDANWELDVSELTPKIVTFLDAKEYPQATTKVDADEKANSFIVTTAGSTSK